MNFYHGLRHFGRRVISLYPRDVEVRMEENLPDKAIFASNHLSFLDPLVMACYLDKDIYFIAHSGFEGTFLGSLISFGNNIILNGDMRVVFEQANERLKQGYLGIFPEGKRSFEGVGDFRKGVEKLARYTQSPVVPIAIQGTDEIWPIDRAFPNILYKGRIKLSVGRAIDCSQINLAEKAREEVLRLLSR